MTIPAGPHTVGQKALDEGRPVKCSHAGNPGNWETDWAAMVGPALVGQLFYDTDNTPVPGKCFAGESYDWADNPLLEAKFQANGHGFIADNGDGTFTVDDSGDFIRPGTSEIGVHVNDTTAANGLTGNITLPRSTNSRTGGSAHRLSSAGSNHTVGTLNISSTDSETAPNHRKAYFGIYGDAA